MERLDDAGAINTASIDTAPIEAAKSGAEAGRRKASGRWWRYSLRGLFLLVTAAAVFCGWVMYRVRVFADQAAFIKELRGRRFVVDVEPFEDPWLWRYLVPKEQLVQVRGAYFFLADHEGPGNSGMWIGPNPADLARMREWTRVWHLSVGGQHITDQTMADWRRRFGRLAGLQMWDTRVTNKGLREIGGMLELEDLTIGLDEKSTSLAHRHANISDEGLAGLAGLKKLNGLKLVTYKIGDEGLRILSDTQPQLEYLAVVTTGKITDAGLKELSRLNLGSLGLYGTEITDEGSSVLYDWKSLYEVSVRSSRMTRHGVKTLMIARPELRYVERMMEEFGFEPERVE